MSTRRIKIQNWTNLTLWPKEPAAIAPSQIWSKFFGCFAHPSGLVLNKTGHLSVLVPVSSRIKCPRAQLFAPCCHFSHCAYFVTSQASSQVKSKFSDPQSCHSSFLFCDIKYFVLIMLRFLSAWPHHFSWKHSIANDIKYQSNCYNKIKIKLNMVKRLSMWRFHFLGCFEL